MLVSAKHDGDYAVGAVAGWWAESALFMQCLVAGADQGLIAACLLAMPLGGGTCGNLRRYLAALRSLDGDIAAIAS